MTQLNRAAKPCDYCNSATALLFCRTDAAFMCMSCDAKVHFTTGERHARVWTCEVCEQAPAAVTCKADAAALCVTCDRDIHAANPLSSRHERVAVVPFFDTAETVVLKSAVAGDVFPAPPMDDVKFDTWVFADSTTTVPSKFNSDQFLEFDSYGISSQPYSDSVVPVQTSETPILNQFNNDYSSETRFEIDFTRSNISLYNTTTSYTTPPLSVSSSSIDVDVVPDGGSLSDISFPFVKNPIANMDPNQGSQVVGMDREARVMRYREKRMNRKFEKTVRYASRKAYAETRPRVKGRFAKKTDTESEIERMFGDR